MSRIVQMHDAQGLDTHQLKWCARPAWKPCCAMRECDSASGATGQAVRTTCPTAPVRLRLRIFGALGQLVDLRLNGSIALIEFSDAAAVTKALLLNGNLYCGRRLELCAAPTPSLSLRELSLAEDLAQLIARAESSRNQLAQSQELIARLSVSGAPLPPELLEQRNFNRVFHIEELRKIGEGNGARLEECARLQREAAALLALPLLDATQSARLHAMQLSLLPRLELWACAQPALDSELLQLQPHASGAPPDVAALRSLHAAWVEAVDELNEAKYLASKRRPPPHAAEAMRDARRRVQQAEATLREERWRVWKLARGHFPELLCEESLRLGAIESETFRALLVERELDQFSPPRGAEALQVLASRPTARHRVLRAEFGVDSAGEGMACVLKEYELDGEGREWRLLVAEVEALHRLVHPHIVKVQAVFQPKTSRAEAASPVAYVQLPFYSHGDAASWLVRCAPELWKRQRMLLHLAQALQHLHDHGFTHGDLKLENVLISDKEFAYLADFESVRTQAPAHSQPSGASIFASIGVRTARYTAPERRLATDGSAPTAAADMYSFGVCALLACCKEDGYHFAPPPQCELRQWSREAAACSGGPHLPSFLEGLLDVERQPAVSAAQAIVRRMSASEVQHHPFLNTEEERKAARIATEAAESTRRLAERQQREMLAENEREQRRLQWEAAERRRAFAEQEHAVRDMEAAVVREKNLLNGARKALEQRQAAVARKLEDETQTAIAIAMQKQKAEVELARLQRSLATERTKLSHLQAEERLRRAATMEQRLWQELAGPCSTEQEVRHFFVQRQPNVAGAGAPLNIESVVRVENRDRLRAFRGGRSFNVVPLASHHAGGDTLLFHGCAQDAATNIQATGLLLAFAAQGMLGRGLYGAPDPRKSVKYCNKGGQGQALGRFMFICRFNLQGASHAGGSTPHRNTVFDEFCVYEEAKVVVLWMIKVSSRDAENETRDLQSDMYKMQ